MTLLSDIISFAMLPTGRAIVALREMRELAVAVFPELVPVIDAALAFAKEVRANEVQWRNHRDKPVESGPLVDLDRSVDRLIVCLHALVENIITASLPGTPVESARKIRDELFPAGPGAITRMSMEQQATEVELVVEKLEGLLAAHVQAVNAQPYVSQIKSINTQITGMLKAGEGATLTWAHVQAGRSRCHEWNLEIIARVVGHYPKENAEHAEGRAKLLRPLMVQQEEVRVARRRRRPPTDVNPDTGATEAPTTDSQG